MLEKMRLALRITSRSFDSEIAWLIEAARRELVRAGVSREKAYDENDELITFAIQKFVQANYSNGMGGKDDAERYRQAFECQLEVLRKSSGYMQEVTADE